MEDFLVDVLHPLSYTVDLFTIEEYDEDSAYAAPRKSNSKQYKIISVKDNIYKYVCYNVLYIER
jgi:hypothetical protein